MGEGGGGGPGGFYRVPAVPGKVTPRRRHQYGFVVLSTGELT